MKKSTILFICTCLTAMLFSCKAGNTDSGNATTSTEKTNADPYVGVWHYDFDESIEVFNLKTDGTFKTDIYDKATDTHDVMQGKYKMSDGEIVMSDIVYNNEPQDEGFSLTFELKGETALINDYIFNRVLEKDVATVLANPTASYYFPSKNNSIAQPHSDENMQEQLITLPPSGKIDATLIGSWQYTDYYHRTLNLSTNQFVYSTAYYAYHFFNDGRFLYYSSTNTSVISSITPTNITGRGEGKYTTADGKIYMTDLLYGGNTLNQWDDKMFEYEIGTDDGGRYLHIGRLNFSDKLDYIEISRGVKFRSLSFN